MADAYGGTRKRLREPEQLTAEEEEAAEKLEFLELLVQAFQMHTDVDLVANDGLTLKSHRVVLASKSPCFRAMFRADREWNDQLKCLNDFLYSAHIPDDKLAQHSHALFIAADQYEERPSGTRDH